MPSRSERQVTCLRPLLAAMLLCVLALGQAGPASAASSPTEEETAAAVAALKADPNLASERSMRVLRWVERDSAPPKPTQSFEWLWQLFNWIAQTSRVIAWLVIGVFVALLVLAIVRLVQAAGPRAAARHFDAPTHVRDLDIRPESLPDDIGAAAFALWESGEHRSALSLLYRGLLSRLAHEHALAIHDSTTEGDCVELARRHMDSGRSGYVSRLVRTWQQAVYGGLTPQTPDVLALCNGFAGALARQPEQAPSS